MKDLNKMDLSVTCKEEVGNSHKAMECNIGERWEHMDCVKERDRSDEGFDEVSD